MVNRLERTGDQLGATLGHPRTSNGIRSGLGMEIRPAARRVAVVDKLQWLHIVADTQALLRASDSIWKPYARLTFTPRLPLT